MTEAVPFTSCLPRGIKPKLRVCVTPCCLITIVDNARELAEALQTSVEDLRTEVFSDILMECANRDDQTIELVNYHEMIDVLARLHEYDRRLAIIRQRPVLRRQDESRPQN